METLENSLKGQKTLTMSNFSFSHKVFKGLVLQSPKNKGLVGKGLTLYHMVTAFSDPREEAFGNMGIEVNACNQYFFFSHNVFYPSKAACNI